jgi:large subunit ribosomal protein L25
MEQLSLQANSRDILGKGVRFLRRQGITPLSLFGHGVESLSLQSETVKVEKSLSLAGETRLIYLTVDKERKARPVLVREIQRDPISRKLLSVNFHQVRMGEKVHVEVPIVLVGKAPALEVKDNALLQELDSLAIESFPDKIPGNLKLDISSLTEAGQVLKVRDIEVGPDIVVTTSHDQVVAAVVARPEQKVEEKPAAVEAVTPAVTPSATEPAREKQEKG